MRHLRLHRSDRSSLRRRPFHGPRLTLLVGASSVPIFLLAASCARTAEERQLDEMREEIDRIQSDRDRADQEALGLQSGDERVARAGAASQQGPPPPPLQVVTVGDGTESETDDPAPDTEDSTPRPTIRVFGSPRAGGRYTARGGDQVEESLPEEGSAATRPQALDPDARRAYDAALKLVNARQYDRALDALAAFLIKWPDHPEADNAMYWRGECYFARGEYARAAEQFEGVVTRFPAGNKVPDALLKAGICDQKLGNPMRAKGWFDRLAQQYPQSDAARRVPTAPVPAVPAGPASEDAR